MSPARGVSATWLAEVRLNGVMVLQVYASLSVVMQALGATLLELGRDATPSDLRVEVSRR